MKWLVGLGEYGHDREMAALSYCEKAIAVGQAEACGGDVVEIGAAAVGGARVARVAHAVGAVDAVDDVVAVVSKVTNHLAAMLQRAGRSASDQSPVFDVLPPP